MYLDIIFTKTRLDSKINSNNQRRPSEKTILEGSGKSKNKSDLIRMEMHSKIFKEGLPTASNAFENLQMQTSERLFSALFHLEGSGKSKDESLDPHRNTLENLQVETSVRLFSAPFSF